MSGWRARRQIPVSSERSLVSGQVLAEKVLMRSVVRGRSWPFVVAAELEMCRYGRGTAEESEEWSRVTERVRTWLQAFLLCPQKRGRTSVDLWRLLGTRDARNGGSRIRYV